MCRGPQGEGLLSSELEDRNQIHLFVPDINTYFTTGTRDLLQYGPGIKIPSPGSHMLYKSASIHEEAPGAVAR